MRDWMILNKEEGKTFYFTGGNIDLGIFSWSANKKDARKFAQRSELKPYLHALKQFDELTKDSNTYQKHHYIIIRL